MEGGEISGFLSQVAIVVSDEEIEDRAARTTTKGLSELVGKGWDARMLDRNLVQSF